MPEEPSLCRVLIVGATGLIGSQIAAALAGRGHPVRGVARDVTVAARAMPSIRWSALDIGRADPAEWAAVLDRVDAVVNCAGALQSGPADDLVGTHARGLSALVAACERAGVRRLVHFSAMGVDRATPTEFSRSKRAGDEALTASALDWIILRPSVVLAPAAYGASALVRGLAALPILPVMPATAPLQPVVLEDVVETVVFFLAPAAPAKLALELAGPDRMDFSDLIRIFRAWLGAPPARELRVPKPVARALYGLGDAAGWLGWRPPVRTTAQREIARGATGDPSQWRRITAIAPRSVAAMLAAHPASVQERWFAGLYLLKPLVLVSLAIFWIGSGVASLGPGFESGIAMMQQGGASGLAVLAVLGGGAADLLVGLGICLRRTARPALVAGIAVALFYALAGSVLTPWLWLDPLAPLLKIAPVAALHLVALAILRGR
ncbi:SDR family oxidoreductase [Xanthobacter sp. KR7-225]|uniref:SDR family oxidoreductase n=1 Tax=Xanthobacter sp. KR7-225 TaxID=3156613 RepID=UPI0032B5AFED